MSKMLKTVAQKYLGFVFPIDFNLKIETGGTIFVSHF
jgi:hypothetical protein